MLRGVQHRELEREFRVPVYDRYMIVVQIFREHAISKEAKLQVALAEIPYLRMKIRGVSEGMVDQDEGAIEAVGGSGETSIDIRRKILNAREIKLKKILEKLKAQRSLIRSNQKKLEYPVVAVIGYTNAGKTSLIKTLTGEKSLVPKNYLFATLDVTAHASLLPCNLKVLYVDTVGFISDIPTHLIAPFMATLEDAMNANVIIHICDVSHPDILAQVDTVNKSLQSLNLSPDLLKNVLVVGNKVDLISDEMRENVKDCNILVSAVTKEGIKELVKKIEECILEATGRVSITIRVPADGEQMRWLYKGAAVTQVIADPQSSQHFLLSVVITKSQLSKFKHTFIQNKKH
ncbi:hypothetical protein L9F63_022521 [Diploptera punctata]|uniref:Hflx-type G domain-containing protein n=1 Tax=Diploptera punctata TaxID=6984 RepID=A0AAD7ZN84_DIPPU|nr:hypothetical protein L9F63_022521 [Diploptera punctata]